MHRKLFSNLLWNIYTLGTEIRSKLLHFQHLVKDSEMVKTSTFILNANQQIQIWVHSQQFDSECRLLSVVYTVLGYVGVNPFFKKKLIWSTGNNDSEEDSIQIQGRNWEKSSQESYTPTPNLCSNLQSFWVSTLGLVQVHGNHKLHYTK